MKDMIGMSIVLYLREVILKVLIVTFLASIIPMVLIYMLNDDYLRFFIVGFASVISSVVFIWLIGLKKQERQFMMVSINKVKSKFIK